MAYLVRETMHRWTVATYIEIARLLQPCDKHVTRLLTSNVTVTTL